MTDAETSIELPVRSTDMDADQVVNNAVYFMYFEQARLAHLLRLGIIRPSWTLDPKTFTIASTEARYLAPTRFPETVRVAAWTREVGNRSFVLGFAAVRTSDGVRVAEGSSVQVWLDEGGAPAPLPETVREALVRALRRPADVSDSPAAGASTPAV